MSLLCIVGSSKRGAGKSLLTMALLDYFDRIGQGCFLIETDSRFIDVRRSYQHIPFMVLDLESKLGPIGLVDLCDEHQDKVIIVNATARSLAGIEKYSQNLISNLTILNRTLITLWVIDYLRSSLDSLEQYVRVMNKTTTHVILNSFFGNEDRFKIYNESTIKEIVEQTGKSLILEKLDERICQKIFDDNSTIENASKEMLLASQSLLFSWRSKCKNMFDLIIDPNYLQPDLQYAGDISEQKISDRSR